MVEFSMMQPQATPQEQDYPDLVPHKGVKYLFEKEIGTGAFGKVYLYRHPKDINDKVAIKIERQGLGSSLITNESYYTRILNDDHHLDCVPKYHGDSFHNRRNYIIIEYIDSTIENYLKLPNIHPGKLSLVELFHQMLRALQSLHGTHHLHRDVKPDNFMISTLDNRVRLIDLGLLINFMPDGVHRQRGRYTF